MTKCRNGIELPDEKPQSSPTTSALNLAFQASNTCKGNGEKQHRWNRTPGIWAEGEKESKVLCQVGVPVYHAAKCVVKSVQKYGVSQAGIVRVLSAPIVA